jgi:hypothetical protein
MVEISNDLPKRRGRERKKYWPPLCTNLAMISVLSTYSRSFFMIFSKLEMPNGSFFNMLVL